VDQAQVGQQVADLAPVVEAGRPDQAVGHPGPAEGFLQGAGLGVGAVHDRALAGGVATFLVEAQDGVEDVAGLVVLVVGFVERDRLALAPPGEQPLGRAVGVGGDHGRGRVQDRLR